MRMNLQYFGGRGASASTGGGSGASNKSDVVRSEVKNSLTNNQNMRMEYSETASGSSWIVSGAPKGNLELRGRSGIEISPARDGSKIKLERWNMDGDKLPVKMYSTVKGATNAAKNYLNGGFRRASR